MANEHEMQHKDSPTWCIHCGTFDIYCDGSDCTDERMGKFDSRVETNFVRIAKDVFGSESPVSVSSECTNADCQNGLIVMPRRRPVRCAHYSHMKR